MTRLPPHAPSVELLVLAMKSAGCECEPEVTFPQNRVVLHHDETCPARHHVSQYVMFTTTQRGDR